MSSIKLSPNASGTGEFTIAAPNSNTNRTLTLPDATGTIAVQGGTGVGKVLQVVQSTYATEVATTSTSLVDTGINVTITPSSSSSKVLLVVIHGDAASQTSANGYNLALLRGSTQIGNRFAQNQMYGATAGAGFNIGSSQTIIYLDSPSTTSTTTYKTQFCSETGGNVILFRDGSQGVMIAMEIAA